MSIIPGDTVRLTITGSDSSVLVDSWSSSIRGPVVGSDNSTLVDTANNVLLGKLDGVLAGNVTASNGAVVLNPGSTGADAVFIGDVTGDLVGEVFGDVTGNLQGDVIDDQENVILDATNRTLTIDTVTVQNIVLQNDLTVTDLTSATATIGQLYGTLLGDVSGQHYGEVFGDVTGDLTGNVTGNLIGNVEGDVFGNTTGEHFGNVVGDVLGDTTGTHTGNVEGNVVGDLEGMVRNESHIGLSISDNGIISIGGSPNITTISTGPELADTTLVNNFREKNDFIVVPHSTNLAGQRAHFHRVSNGEKASIAPGEILDFKAILAHNGTDYAQAGAWGYIADPESTISNTGSIRTLFGVSVADGTNPPDIIGPKRLSVNHQGTVGGYAFQAHPINSTQRNDLDAQAGMIIFNNSTNKFQGYNGSMWVDIS
jgi:hypothetical protein